MDMKIISLKILNVSLNFTWNNDMKNKYYVKNEVYYLNSGIKS